MSSFPSIRIEGGLLGPELLDQVIAADVPGQKPADFGLEPKRNLTDEIAAVFADSRALWGVFKSRLTRLPENDLATTVTRDQWALPFLALLGYQARYNSRAFEVDGQSFAVSHRAGEAEDTPPIHVVGARQELGRVPPSGRPRMAPHSLVQEYLNRTEHVWGIVTNGLTLRLLRDSSLVRRQAYIEFDLQAIFEEQRFHDFAALYRLIHRSRLPRGMADASECLLERYYAQTIEQGGRVREHLRDGVEECLKLLGNGFLTHKDNEELRQKLKSQQLTPAQFYRQLFRIVYRFLFLLVSEDRGLISPNQIYRDHYGIARLRRMLDVQAAWTDHADLWLSLRTLWKLFGDDKLAKILDLAPLNGELFAPQTLDGCVLSNRDLLHAFWHLAYYQERQGAPARRVNYSALDVEELGSVYESLLEFHPDVATDAAGLLHFDLIFGSERKTTGSFYTPPELVNELIESALMPVVRQRLDDAAKADKRNGTGTKHQQAALLSLKIIDIACGSGHMLLAAARRVGKELAKLRTGEDEPAPERIRESIRDVISHCIYGVDRNPLAVDLCRVALWLESHTAGKPLTFLDHRIRCGDSLVGVFDLDVLKQGIPDKAFDPCEGDDKPTARAAAKKNKEERRGAQDLFAVRDSHDAEALTRHSRDVDAIPDDSPELIRRKKELFEASHRDPAWQRQKQACDLWTAAFFQTLATNSVVITSAALADHLGGRPIDARLHGRAGTLALGQPFFHWPLEFPEVFAVGGFDVVLSNPPWERIKLQEQEFFAARDPRIATAANKAARAKLIPELIQKNPALHAEFIAAVHAADCVSKFLRQSNRFPLTATGDINTYAVFAETIVHLLNPRGSAGVIVPTGIATDDTTKDFFQHITIKRLLSSLYDFQSGPGLFSEVGHQRYKFCLLTLNGSSIPTGQNVEFAFFLRSTSHLRNQERRFTLNPDDIVLLNPNTKTCPIFRTRDDAELTRKLYQRVPVFVREGSPDGNPWSVSFMRMLDMSNDSHIFATAPGDTLFPLYEAKMMHQFEHRFATYDVSGDTRDTTAVEKQDAAFRVRPRYWVEETEVLNRLAPPTDEERKELDKGSLQPAELLLRQRERASKWLLGFRDICRAPDERTAILSFLPRVAVGHTMPLVLTCAEPSLQLCLCANLNSLVSDYVTRQKLGGTHLTYGYLKQIPVLPPSFYRAADVAYVASRVLELVYTADDMQPLADALRAAASPLAATVPRAPYRWDEARRALLRAELDAWYARAYGLTRDELRYILDPADVHGPDFPGETFRVLKEKETAKFGEYRTRRLVLEAWDRLPAG
jgi:methylase of polypeptide subunit release factors